MHGPNTQARSPMYPGHLEPTPPHTPGSSRSRPTSPALSSHSDQLSRSISSNSSTTSSLASGGSSRTPFFDRYNKLVVGSEASGGHVNLAGVGMRNLDLTSPRTEGFAFNAAPSQGSASMQRNGSPSPSPSPNSSQPPHPVPARQIPMVSEHSSISQPPVRPHSPLHQGSQVNFGRSESGERLRSRGDESASVSDRSFLPPRTDSYENLRRPEGESAPDLLPSTQISGLARSPSASSSVHSVESAYIAYDRRDTLKPSKSARTRYDTKEGGGSVSSLDALEDLLLMAREGAVDDDGSVQVDEDARASSERALQQEFLAPSWTTDHTEKGTSASRSAHEEADTASTPRAPTSRIPTSTSVPSLGSFSHAASSARNGALAASGSSPNLSSVLHGAPPTKFDCTTCRKRLKPSQIQKAGDGQLFCRECYAERYLPKCRKCERAIEGGAVTSADGKIVGKYHPACFSCFSCSKTFPSGDFYVYDGKPYCQYDYHSLNGSLCTNKSCGTPIEGPCVSLVGEENGGGGRYHPKCFVCSIRDCSLPLLEHHFVVDRLPFCESHSSGFSQTTPARSGGSSSPAKATSRAKKRQTIITR
ncbi:hypothetical protein JCM3766R1_000148 [Sporobolomyces carnicolor]